MDLYTSAIELITKFKYTSRYREYYQNCSVLDCVTVFSQQHTYMSSCPTDWVCRIGTLMLCVEAVA